MHPKITNGFAVERSDRDTNAVEHTLEKFVSRLRRYGGCVSQGDKSRQTTRFGVFHPSWIMCAHTATLASMKQPCAANLAEALRCSPPLSRACIGTSPHFSRNRAHRGCESAKVVVPQRLLHDSRKPRCRQSVAQNGLILEWSKAGLWKPHSMRGW